MELSQVLRTHMRMQNKIILYIFFRGQKNNKNNFCKKIINFFKFAETRLILAFKTLPDSQYNDIIHTPNVAQFEHYYYCNKY